MWGTGTGVRLLGGRSQGQRSGREAGTGTPGPAGAVGPAGGLWAWPCATARGGEAPWGARGSHRHPDPHPGTRHPPETEDTGTGWPRPLPRHLLLPVGLARGAAPHLGGWRKPPQNALQGEGTGLAGGASPPPCLPPPLATEARLPPWGGDSAPAKARPPPAVWGCLGGSRGPPP